MCGITTGGKEECFWNCDIGNTVNGLIVSNPECLLDCFEEVKKLTSLSPKAKVWIQKPKIKFSELGLPIPPPPLKT